MASKYDWDFIRPLDQAANIAAMASGNQQINTGLQGISNAVTGYADAIKQRNTDEIMNALYQAQSSADLPNAMNAVQALQQQFGRGYNQNTIREAVDQRGTVLNHRDMQAMQLKQAQDTMAARPKLNQVALNTLAQRANLKSDTLNGLADSTADLTGFINSITNNAVGDQRYAESVAERKAAADQAQNNWQANYDYRIGRDVVEDARSDRAETRANIGTAASVSPLFAEAPTNQWVTDADGNPVQVTTGGVSKADAFNGVLGAISGLTDKIHGVESGHVANAKNPKSSATGAGQFIESTWLSMLSKHRPDLVQGKSRSQLLELRKDPALSRQMTEAYNIENADGLRKAGLPVTEGTTYLAYFAGLGGAKSLLRADRNASAESILGKDAADRNGSIIRGKTAGQVIDWANKQMGGTASAATKAVQGGGIGISNDKMTKINTTYNTALAKLDADYNLNKATAQAKGSVAATGKNVDTWVASKKETSWTGNSTNPIVTKAGDIGAMARQDAAFNALPDAAQIKVLEGAYGYLRNSGKLEYVPNQQLRDIIHRDSTNHTKSQSDQYNASKKALMDQAYSSLASEFKAVGSKPPSRDGFYKMLDPSYEPPKKATQAKQVTQPVSQQATNIVKAANDKLPTPAPTKLPATIARATNDPNRTKVAEHNARQAAARDKRFTEAANRKAAEERNKQVQRQNTKSTYTMPQGQTSFSQKELEEMTKKFNRQYGR